ncbi:hypothetical protein BGZ68_004902 [Mortierella alpina]|nr:hypothetical protein BGZ68_004902 [Mortierella alpina]
MVNKHPYVKLDWKVPEPIKAGSEMLRGVLVINAKELSESEMRSVASQNVRSANTGSASRESGNTMMKNVINVLMHHKRDRMVRIEHIEIDLTGVEGLVDQRHEAGPRLDLRTVCTLTWAQSPAYNIYTVLDDRLGIVHSVQSVFNGYCQLQKGSHIGYSDLTFSYNQLQ